MVFQTFDRVIFGTLTSWNKYGTCCQYGTHKWYATRKVWEPLL